MIWTTREGQAKLKADRGSAIADGLGISYRTLKRRKADRLRQNDPM